MVWTTVGAAMLMVALGGCAGKPGAPATSPPHPVGALQHFDQAVAPGYAGLSCQQKIDRSLAAPFGYRGVVEGVITGPAVQSFVAVGSDPQNVLHYLDYPFRIISFHGKGAPPYPAGSSITLRVSTDSAHRPDGTVQQLVDINPPIVREGDHLFVWYHPHPGVWGGGHTARRLVAQDAANVSAVRGDTVTGLGNEPCPQSLAVFLRHFSH